MLRGLATFLSGKGAKPIIVCEVKPWEVTKLGGTLDGFDQYMKGFGYRTHIITQADRPISLTSLVDMEVVVFHA